jgi:hypothetical protein
MFGLLASLFALYLHNGPARIDSAVAPHSGSGSTHTLQTSSPVSADSPPKSDGGTVPPGGG